MGFDETFDGFSFPPHLVGFGEVKQWLSGQIFGNEFLDISGNGLHADIIDNDISSTFGFPYKSSAKIAQKAANFGVIPDPTNFWYTPAGVPNQIPVTSLFQNIDYVNQIFCRHIAQELDANLVEVTEPKIVDIVTYVSALSGSALTLANTYFGVPTKDVTAKWIDPVNGNDTTGTGTEASPYKTIVGTEAKVFSAGQQIYIKSGNEAFATRWTASRSYKWKCLGYTKVTGTVAAVVFLNNTGVELEGICVDATGRSDGIYFKLQSLVKRCFVFDTGATAIGVHAPTDSSGGTLRDCAFHGLNRAISNERAINTFNFIGNYCSSTCTSGYVAATVSTTITVVFKYNRFKKSGTINGSFTSFSIFNNELPYSFLPTSGAYTGTISIRYNTFTPTSSITTTLGSSVAHAERYIYTIEYNTFNIGSSITTNCIILVDQVAPVIRGNVINISGGSNTSGGIFVDAISTDCHPATIDNNVYSNSNPNLLNYVIQVGNENVGAGDDNLRESILTGNKILLSGYFGTGENEAHGIFVTRNTGCVVKYNYVVGAGLGIVFKSTNQNNANAVCDYNILYNCSRPLTAKGITNTKFYNNTILNEGDVYASVFNQVIQNVQGATGTEFKNNIILNRDSFNVTPGQQALVYVDANSAAGFVSDYNDMYSENNSIALINITYYDTFPDWQAAGYDTNGTSQDVSFVETYDNDDHITKKLWLPDPQLLSGFDLGVLHDDALDYITDWYDSPPTIVNSSQLPQWAMGAVVE